MDKQLKEIEIPFGAKDSELCGWEYTIPEGMEATIVDNKIVIKKKESEDERIRKELIFYLGDMPEDTELRNGVTNRDVLAWLEKHLDNIAKEVIKDKDTAISFLKSCGIMNEKGELADEYKIEQDEQNLAENSEKKSEDVIEEKDMTEYNKGFECGKQRVLKYPEDFNLHKNPTWSEEDAINLTNTIRALQSLGMIQGADHRYDNLINWLKFLKNRVFPQLKQWSEEDKNRFRNLIYLVEHSNEGKGTKEGFVKFINRLKERFTWKPSDEQMEVLVWCKPLFADPKSKGILESLINDLKKLREE